MEREQMYLDHYKKLEETCNAAQKEITGMKMIRLYIKQGQWLAEHTMNEFPDMEIVSLFGTNVLPTPFNATAPREMVMTTISERNPGVAVCVS